MMIRVRALALLLAGLLLTSTLLVGQPYPPPWRDISRGLRRAATIHALAASPDGRTLYAAAYEPGGLARSVDGGRTWQRVAAWDGWGVPLSVAVAPDDAHRVYVGLVDGALRSVDGGQTWIALPALAGLSVNAWLFAPDGLLSTGHCVYAGTSAGLFASTDGGVTWSSPPGAPNDAVLALLLDPTDPQILYVGTDRSGVHVRDADGWRGGGQGHANVLLGDADTGHVYTVALHRLFRTADRGRTWQELPWPADTAPPLSLAVAGPVLYAGAVENQGLYRSADAGVTWQRLDSPASAGTLHGSTVLSILVIPPNGSLILAGTERAGLFASADGGDTWQPAALPLGAPRLSAILPHPTQPGLLFAGAADGVYRSTDQGASWQLVTGALGRLDVLALATHPHDPRILYAGTTTGVYRSTDGGDTWQPWMTGIPDVTIYSFTFDPADPRTIYAGSRGNNVCRTTDGGESWAPIHSGLETLTAFDVLVDARDPRVLTVGTVEGLYRSVDGGATWARLQNELASLSVFCLLEVEGALPTGQGVYAGATDGVYVSRDGGSTWTAQRQGLGTNTVVCLVNDPTRPGVLYAGTVTAGLYRSADYPRSEAEWGGGATWQSWARGLEGASVYDLAFDPFDRDRLYAATDRGAFVLEAWMP